MKKTNKKVKRGPIIFASLACLILLALNIPAILEIYNADDFVLPFWIMAVFAVLALAALIIVATWLKRLFF